MPVHTERFTRSHPCPICGGWDQQPRDRGLRCYGYLDSTGEYARCTREEFAGPLERNSDDTFSHLLQGHCACGNQHGTSQPRANSNGSSSTSSAQHFHLERSFEVCDRQGKVIAVHDRLVDAGGEKKYLWRLPGKSEYGLQGLKVTELPLFGSEHLPQQQAGSSIVLVEGEKAAQALLEAGIPALGTVTGAGSPESPKRPSDEVLASLKGLRPVLWPDNDEQGRTGHMTPIAQALHGLGVEVRWVEWPEAPEKADAADFLADHDREQTFVLLRTAQPWSAEKAETATERVELVEQRTPRPEALGEAAFHGLAGRLSKLIDPYVESNEASVLVQFLCAFGVAAGLHPHLMVGATRHAPTTYIGLVGPTSMGRKGTAWDPVETLFRLADPDFAKRVMSGIGSGERLPWLVRDPTYDKEGKLVDEGASDRRLLLQEPELARLLAVVNREGSTLSAYLRQAYDGKPLRNEVKSNGSVASLHHIGLIGHCTDEELRDQLKEQQVRNGLANRLLWVLAQREKRLEDPPVFEGQDVEEAAQELRSVLEQARATSRLRRSAEAQKLYGDWYVNLPDDGAGITGAITARAAAQVIRFSVIYALTDATDIIGREHMEAALALWEHSARCVHYIWGGGTGDLIADRIFEELAYGPLTMTQLYSDVFSRNVSGPVLEKAVRLLEGRQLVARERVHGPGRGRPALRVRRIK